MDLTIREVTRDEVFELHKLEADCYPDDEAASCKMLLYRHTEAPDLTLGCYLHNQLVGLICATRYHGKVLTNESMNMHIPNGESVCIHSVAVHKDYRRMGIASRLLSVFTAQVQTRQRDVARLLLICKSHLIPLYTRAGFLLNGKSAVLHGQLQPSIGTPFNEPVFPSTKGMDPWYECSMSISGS